VLFRKIGDIIGKVIFLREGVVVVENIVEQLLTVGGEGEEEELEQLEESLDGKRD